MPIEIVNQIMKDEGINDSSEFLNLNPQIFNDHFGSDAILFTEIIKWDTSYAVISGSVTVQIMFLLKLPLIRRHVITKLLLLMLEEIWILEKEMRH